MTDWQKAHADLATLFDGVQSGGFARPGEDFILAPYAGYTPDVAEVPNGDAGHEWKAPADGGLYSICAHCQKPHYGDGPVGPCPARASRIDTKKRYLHVATKYNPPAWADAYRAIAHDKACQLAEKIGVPAAYYPRAAYGALRVLEYPSAGHRWGIPGCQACGEKRMDPDEVCPALAAGAGTAEHTDPDLFTVNLWRSHPDDIEARVSRKMRLDWHAGGEAYHIGEIGALVGLGPATPHRVPARPYVQRALVYFAIPDWAASLPAPPVSWGGVRDRCPTVGEWLDRAVKARRVAK